ncbi:MAG: hypothetical protein WAN47_03115 [Nitrosotalea sp.]
MCFVTVKEAKKWFIEYSSKPQNFRITAIVINEYEQQHPNEYVINDDNTIMLDGEKLDVDLNDKTLIFHSIKGPYPSHSKTSKRKLTRITLNQKILDCADHESMKIRVVMPDGEKRILKPEQIPKIKKNRPQIRGEHRLHPIDLTEMQVEPEDKTSKNNKKITDYDNFSQS